MPFPPVGFPTTGPPFGMYPLAPAALMVTEGLRLWSPEAEILFAVLPLATLGIPTTGTAGGITILPFTGEMDFDLPCCAEAGPPTATVGIILPDAAGGENGFLVALA